MGHMAVESLDAITVTQRMGLQVTHWVSSVGLLPEHHKRGGSAQQKCILSQFWRAAARVQGEGRVGSFSEALREDSSASAWGRRPSLVSLGLYTRHSKFCFRLQRASSLCVSVSQCPSSL